ncbi:MAG: hypothetical protein J6K52_03520 [Clostridia bacterium]|nr:hypothetical protein [Clostridia bacterium]
MTKLKMPFLYFLSFALSLLPALIFFIVNSEKYVMAVPDRVKLTFGGIIICILLIMKVSHALRVSNGITFFGLVFILSYLFEPIIEDIMIFSFLAIVGELLSLAVRAIIRSEREKMIASKTAAEVKELLKNN